MMKLIKLLLVMLAITGGLIGCSGRVETDEDSTNVGVEAPKVEVGEAPLDLDPSTDDDVDIDTPAPGDK